MARPRNNNAAMRADKAGEVVPQLLPELFVRDPQMRFGIVQSGGLGLLSGGAGMLAKVLLGLFLVSRDSH
jgi:hypothetical protein